MTKRQMELECNTDGDLAFDQAGLLSYETSERWHTKLFQAKGREPPPSYRCVSAQQMKQFADDPEVTVFLQPLPMGTSNGNARRSDSPPGSAKRKSKGKGAGKSADAGELCAENCRRQAFVLQVPARQVPIAEEGALPVWVAQVLL